MGNKKDEKAATLGQPPYFSYHTIKTIVNQILSEKTAQQNQNAKQLSTQSERKTLQSEEIAIEDAALELERDGHSAIVDSIAAFHKK